MTERKDFFETMGKRMMKCRIATENDKCVKEGRAHLGDILFYRIDQRTTIIASVHPDNVFDADGNRFDY